MMSNVERRGMSMTDVQEKLITVIKRNGKKVDFDESKIALAIGKAFDNVNIEDEEGNKPYNEKDIGKVLDGVLKKIEKDYPEKIKIEQIQDLIEKT